MRRRLPRIVLLLALVGAAAWTAGHWAGVQARLETAGAAGWLVFAGAFVLLTMGCFPVSVLGFTAGAVYGPGPGFLLVVPSVAAGGTLMFLLGRSLLREPIRRRLQGHPRGRALADLAAARALRLNLLARLSPFNFGIVCYTLAAGRTPLRTYLLGLAGTLPSLVVHVLAGTLARSGGAALGGGDGISALEAGVTAAALLALLLLAWQVGRMALAAWNRAASAAEEGPAGSGEGEERQAP